MSEKPKYNNRIPFEQLQDAEAVSPWSLPAVDSGSRVYSAQKNAKQSAQKHRDELIEDYQGTIKSRPLTADVLQKITEEAKQEGHERGYQEGLEKGLAEGLEQGRKSGHEKAFSETRGELEDAVKRLSSIADALLVPMREQTENLEKIVVDMAIHCAKALIDRELEQSPEWIENIIQKALSALPSGSENIMVYLSERDARLFDEYSPSGSRQWRVHADKKLQSGGCRVETTHSLVDYSVEHRLANYLQRVEEHDGETMASSTQQDSVPLDTSESNPMAGISNRSSDANG